MAMQICGRDERILAAQVEQKNGMTPPDGVAEVLYEAGFAVLLYDHRNFGISEGEPRGEINPWVQARGYRDAIDYVSSLPELDKSRVAVWGDSFSAGQVLVVGACEDRVKAIVSQTCACGPPYRRRIRTGRYSPL
jgi:uncharacterized protein